METESQLMDFQDCINGLLDALQILLDANKAMGERASQFEMIVEDYEDLNSEDAKLKGELAMRKRGQHGIKSEKAKETSKSDSASECSKDEDEACRGQGRL